jgi:nitroreductase
MSLIESLNWRYATTKFDTSKTISDVEVDKLKEITKLSPSSWGFQFYKVLVITDKKLKQQLLPTAYNQSQIVDCSHLFIFCSYKSVFESDIDQMIEEFHYLRANDENYSKESTDKYASGAKKSILNMNQAKQLEWLKKQCYIALGQLMVGCADMRIDSCPMEGFKSDEVDEILDLHSQNLTSVVLLPTGYRSAEDKYQHKTKVRKPNNLLFEDK